MARSPSVEKITQLKIKRQILAEQTRISHSQTELFLLRSQILEAQLVNLLEILNPEIQDNNPFMIESRKKLDQMQLEKTILKDETEIAKATSDGLVQELNNVSAEIDKITSKTQVTVDWAQINDTPARFSRPPQRRTGNLNAR